jgi:hypothetical protein
MNGLETSVATFQQCPSLGARLSAGSLMFLLLFGALPARSATPQVPWECSTYEGDAQTRCLNTFIEFQRDKIGQLEGQLQAQQSTVGQLKSQIENQAAATADLQRQLSERSAASVAPIPYPYGYAPYPYLYPPSIGFGFYLGRPWMYGSPFYYRPFGGPRFYRHWGHRR